MSVETYGPVNISPEEAELLDVIDRLQSVQQFYLDETTKWRNSPTQRHTDEVNEAGMLIVDVFGDTLEAIYDMEHLKNEDKVLYTAVLFKKADTERVDHFRVLAPNGIFSYFQGEVSELRDGITEGLERGFAMADVLERAVDEFVTVSQDDWVRLQEAVRDSS